MTHFFPYFEPVRCSMLSSNCSNRFLWRQVRWSGILISWRNFQFVVIHTVKGFSAVSEAEVDTFLELACFSLIQWMLAIWSLVPLPFLNPAWISGSSLLRRTEASLVEFWTLLRKRLLDTKFSASQEERMSSWRDLVIF